MLSIASGALATNGSRGSVTAFTGGSAFLPFTRIRGTTTFTSSSLTINHAYDPLYRLTTANYSSGKVFTYTYDAVGNRLSDGAPAGVTTYAYDNANRLTTINGTTNYSWDNNRNLLNNGGGITYTYDAANRLVAQNASLYTFGYDGFGDRVQQLANGVPITYALDEAAGLTQVLSETAGAATTRYLYGLGRIDQQTSASTDYFLGDALGSVRQLANTSGNVTLQKSYDPYGQTLSSSGTGSSNYGFAGEYMDQTGLSYLRARYYIAQRGRFNQKDSWNGSYWQPMSRNGWSYGMGNPIDNTDPSGNITKAEDPAATVIVLSLANYGVIIQKDWGPDRIVWLQPVWPLVSMVPLPCSWHDGAWKTLEELQWVQKSVMDTVAVMGGPFKFLSAMHNSVQIVRLGIPPTDFPIIGPIRPFAPPSGLMLGDVALPDYVFINGEDYALYSVVHELGHVWDRRTGLQLSQGMMRSIGTQRCNTSRGQTNCYFDITAGKEAPPGYTDPKKVYAGTNAMEDWAETFASNVYPTHYVGAGYTNLGPMRKRYVDEQIAAIP